MTQWLDSIAPEHVPGGGLTSITTFSLNALYELHKKARNWWTYSNCKLPLIRYQGCTIKLYRSTSVDYVTVWATCGDMSATEKLYQSTQPSILLYNKNKRIVTTNTHKQHRKPYKKIFIKPPAMWENKWYFQQDICKLPLFLLITSACSLGRYYMPSTAISNTIGFTSLNTDFFKLHNWKSPSPTTGYRPNTEFYLYTFNSHTHFEIATYKDLIYLGNTKDWGPGLPIDRAVPTGDWNTKVETYFGKLSLWGNAFYSPYWDPNYENLIITKKTFEQIKTQAKETNGTKKLSEGDFFTKLSQPLTWECRYNSQQDQSHNAVFFTPVTGTPTPWETPHVHNLISDGLPLWLILNGLIDYHRKRLDIQGLMTDYVLAIVSDYIEPKNKSYYVPLDQDFLQGKSPYEGPDGVIHIYDAQNWFPKVNFQQQTINDIITTGPATAKLPKKISAEAYMSYKFHFKLGGCPAPMDDICDPCDRGKFPTPSNFISSTLLQSPETPVEYYLHAFDQRRDLLTERASKRIKKDRDSKQTIFASTGHTQTEVPIRTPETSSTETSSEEEKEDEETLLLNVNKQRRKQRKLRHRILKLLQLTENL